jgi:ABC-type anion transport system duplicated permease subunit
MTHRQELAETIYDDEIWNPPDLSIVATAYYKPETVRFEISDMPTCYIEADGAYNLSDMI